MPPEEKSEIKTHVFLLGLPRSGKSALRQVAFHGKTLDDIKYRETKKPVILKPKNKPNYVFHDYGGKEKDFENVLEEISKIPEQERRIIVWILDASNVESLTPSIKQLKLIREKLGASRNNLQYVLGVSKTDLLNNAQLTLLKEQLPPKIQKIFGDNIPIAFFNLKDKSYGQFVNLILNIFDNPELVKPFFYKATPTPELKTEPKTPVQEEITVQQPPTPKTSQEPTIKSIEKKDTLSEPSISVPKKKKKKKIKKTGVRLSTELGIKKQETTTELPELEELPSLDGAITPITLTKEEPSVSAPRKTQKRAPSTVSSSEELPPIEEVASKPLLPEEKMGASPVAESVSPEPEPEKVSDQILEEIDTILEEVEKSVTPKISEKPKEPTSLLPPDLAIEAEETVSEPVSKPKEEKVSSVIEEPAIIEEPEIEEVVLPKPEEPVFQRLPPPIPLDQEKESEPQAPSEEEELPELQVKKANDRMLKEYCEKHNIHYFRLFADFGVIDIEYKKPELEYFSEISNQLIDKFQTAQEEEILEQNFNGTILYTIIFPKIIIIVGVPEEIAEQFYQKLPTTKKFVNELLKQAPFAKVFLTEEQIQSIPPLHTPEISVEEEPEGEEIEEEQEEIEEEIPEYPVVSLKNIEKEGTIIIFRREESNDELEFVIAFSSEQDPNPVLQLHLPIITTMINETKETKFFDTEDHSVAIRVGKEYVVVILTKSKYDHKTIIRYLGQILVYLALLRTKRVEINFKTLSKDAKLLNLSKTFLSSTIN